MKCDAEDHERKGAPVPARTATPENATAGVRVEKLSFFQDQRGKLVEPLAAEQIREQGNVHLVITEPGCIRGNHYHTKGTEILVMFGPGLVRWREGGVLREEVLPEGACMRFTIPPGVSHAFQNVGPRPTTAISFNTHRHDPSRPDVVPDILIPVKP